MGTKYIFFITTAPIDVSTIKRSLYVRPVDDDRLAHCFSSLKDSLRLGDNVVFVLHAFWFVCIDFEQLLILIDLGNIK